MSNWSTPLYIHNLPSNLSYPPTLTLYLTLPHPSILSSLSCLSHDIGVEMGRCLGLENEMVIIDKMSAWWGYDFRTQTGYGLYRLNEESFRWMLENVRIGGGYLVLDARMVPPVGSSSSSRTRTPPVARPERSEMEHSQYGFCTPCAGVCREGAVSPGGGRREEAGERRGEGGDGDGDGAGCYECPEARGGRRRQNGLEDVHGR